MFIFAVAVAVAAAVAIAAAAAVGNELAGGWWLASDLLAVYARNIFFSSSIACRFQANANKVT